MIKYLLRAFFCISTLASTWLLLMWHSPATAQTSHKGVELTWFVGFGTGTSDEQWTAQQAILAAWNKANPDITVQMQTVRHNTPQNAFSTALAAGVPPAIVGPMGLRARGQFQEAWLDLLPLIEADRAELNLDDYEPILLERLKVDSKLIGLPMVIYPSALWVNEDLFKAAGIEPPPTEYGANGTATYQGKAWDMTALRELAMRLTLDKNGKHAGQLGFDPANIVSYGYSDIWTDLRGWVTHFHTEDAGLANQTTATFDQKPYQTAVQYLHNGIYKDYFMPNQSALNNITASNPFSSGKIAMFSAGSWFTCCVADLKTKNWRLAVAPAAPDGTLTARLDADVFTISKGAEHIDAAWKFLKYLYSPEISAKLAMIYGGMPARKSLYTLWETLPNVKKYPQLDNQIFYGAIPYADNPGYDGYLPNQNAAENLLYTYWEALSSNPTFAPVDELKSLNEKLQAIFDEANKSSLNSNRANKILDQPMLTAQITSVAFSPDGTTVLTGRDDGSARLWNAANSSVIRTLQKHQAAVLSVAISPDGTLAATASADTTVRLWNLSTGSLMRTLSDHTAAVNSVAFSPDGTLLLTGSSDSTARLWRVETGTALQTYVGHSAGVMDVAFSPDGKQVLTGSEDNTARLWNTLTGQTVKIFTGHSAPVLAVAFSPDGKQVLTGSDDDMAYLWDVGTAQRIHSFAHKDKVFDVAFSIDGKLILTADCDNDTRLWDTATGNLVTTLEGHTAGVRGAAFSPDNRAIVTGSQDRTARLWDIAQANTIRTFPSHIGYTEDVAFTPDGKTLVAVGRDETARLWDAQSGKPLNTVKLHGRGILELAIAPDGRTALAGGEDGKVYLWEIATGRIIYLLRQSDSTTSAAPIASVAFSPDGKYAVAGSKDFTITTWNTQTGERVTSWYQYGTGVYSMSFAKDTQSAIVGDYDGMVYLWETHKSSTTGYIKPMAKHKRGVLSVAFAPDNSSVLTSGSDGTVYLWQVGADQPQREYKAFNKIISSLQFAPDGKTFLAGDMDGSIRLIDLQTGKTLRTFTAHSEGVTTLTFAPDSQTFASGAMDGTVCVWDFQSGALLRVLE